MRRIPFWLVALVVVAVAWMAWRRALDLSLYAWDTYPLIESARVESFGDLFAPFARELMDGRFPGGHFYRPLVELSFALDHAWSGLDAFGYHLTDFLLLVSGALLIARLAGRWLGERASVWPALAGLVFVLHPVQFEVLPLPPRRADALALVFTLLALGFDAFGNRERWFAAVACAAAVASKETGAVAALLVLALWTVRSGEPTLLARVRSAWSASWRAFALVAIVVVARTMVLGGLGGGVRTSVAGGASELPHVVERYALLVLAPLPPFDASSALVLGVASLLVALLFASVLSKRDDESPLEPRAAGTVVLAWFALLVGITALAGTYRAWYALQYVAPLALLAALAAGHATPRTKPLVMLAVVGLLLLQGWSNSSETRWREIEASSQAARTFLADLDTRIAAAAPGSTLRVDAFPDDAATTRHGAEIKKAMIFAPYSLEAYAALRWPDRALRFEVARESVDPAGASEVLVLLSPRE